MSLEGLRLRSGVKAVRAPGVVASTRFEGAGQNPFSTLVTTMNKQNGM